MYFYIIIISVKRIETRFYTFNKNLIIIIIIIIIIFTEIFFMAEHCV